MGTYCRASSERTIKKAIELPPVLQQIEGESAVTLSNLKVTINFFDTVGGGPGNGGETVREGISAVEVFGGFLGFEEEALEAIVSSSP
ncbi:hypothetical protein SESBI_11423 [Sesbania bispinosa]|nr:hypothetical protein SESBI_11423 [Sesbania bispinosa]